LARIRFRSLISDGLLGGRISRRDYDQLIEDRDREWRETTEESSLPDRLEKKYQEERAAWQA
jgi:hypothetical protein